MIDRFKECLSEIKNEEDFDEAFFGYSKKNEKKFLKLENYIETHDFDNFMLRLAFEHNEDYRENCYSKGYEPYPNNKLQLLIDYISTKYDSLDDVRGLDNTYPNTTYEFKGYYFQFIYGQGTITRVYNSHDMKLILQV